MPRLESSASSGGSTRRSRAPRVSTALAEINVVPLVDVMLVLLVIFMVTAPMMQQGLAVNLPQSRRSTPITAEPIYVTIPVSFRNDNKVELGDEKIRLELLAERVKYLLGSSATKDVFLRSDDAVTMGEAIRVWDKLKDGGVERLSIATQPPKSDR
jgi:biopolymer transport protein TolR